MNNISSFIRFQRKKLGITQEELATKAGVGVRFIRELEQGKSSLQLDKVEQVLHLFGFQLTPNKQQLDPYDIFWNYINKGVKITLFNKVIKYGIIIEEIIDKKENKIIAWKFVPNNNAILYQRKPDDKLTEIITHSDIFLIENQ
ncbi:MAG: helix-turn-helix transcriptional regulator [Flavobacteriales bacterium]|jgi:y4mF family transcriptional regulator|nr:helix-turn-helix transcriptional regulator [Flavobacteriales bacterium]